MPEIGIIKVGREDKTMKEMLEKRLAELEWDYIRNENKDRGYDFNLARTLKAEMNAIREELAKM